MTIKADKLGPGFLKFGETGTEQEFGSQVTKLELTPEFEDGDVLPVLSGEELSGDDTESYKLGGEFLQDYSGMSSLIVWCKTNSGTDLPFEYVPNKEGGLKVNGVAKIRAVKIGGDVKQRNTTEFEFKGVGDYEFTEYVPEAG